MSPLNLFIIGPSGCGKSTQAKLIADKYHLTPLSMGQLLRDEIAVGSGFGLEAKTYLDRGIWVPDDLTFDVLVNKLKQFDFQNFIIDGFPRVLNQGKIIEFFLKKQAKPFSLLIHLEVSQEEIIKRRQKEGESFQDSTRSDNTPEAIKQRQLSYDETINPIKDYFRSIGKLFNVNGNRPVEPIFTDICQAVDSLK
jgi:adenylate kinase